MRILSVTKTFSIVAIFGASALSYADGYTDYSPQQPGTASDSTVGTTSTQTTSVTKGFLKNQVFTVSPEVGVLGFQDNTRADTARGALGIGFDMNIAPLAQIDPTWYVGPSTGFIYSHLGTASSNFWGTNPGNFDSQSNANMYIIPADLKVAYNFSDYFRFGVHGGGNITYRTVANSINLGASSFDPNYVWTMLPNAGLDIEAALGKNVNVGLKPDMTFSSGGTNFYTVMLGLGIDLA